MRTGSAPLSSFLGFVLPVVALLLPLGPATKRLASAVLVLMLAVLTGLVGLYPLKGWFVVRALLFLSPWFAMLLTGILSERGAGVLRWSVAIGALGLFGVASLRAVEGLAADRRGEQAANNEVATSFLRLTDGVPIETAIVWENPWEIGWRRFPVTIVWNGPRDPASLRRVGDMRRIDAVFGSTGPLLARKGRERRSWSPSRPARSPTAERAAAALPRSDLRPLP